ncbi:MAG: hypothetical protein WDO24_06070 [Pseudomonadota bacterium]
MLQWWWATMQARRHVAEAQVVGRASAGIDPMAAATHRPSQA